MSYNEYWQKIYRVMEEWNKLSESYWRDYSGFSSWQFWVILAMVVIPLIVLIFAVDRRRIFEVLFFGYTVHILWDYINDFLEIHLFFVHNYFLTTMLPSAFNMTASVLPVAFLLLYQYCTNHNKNFYLLTLVLSGIFAFGAASLEEMIGMVDIKNGFNKFYIFLIDVGIAYIAYWFTRFILKVRKRAGVQSE
ncbi:hypothetical protein E3U55_10650 [Filobacillus milosensis]|uniref:Uncharacterized protein n=1 Tax=Filobacillus milosensis TaxID=94137 RepID=A0A4Y8IMZ6_9BACI|nr:hypothetical protein [Filobacillus milosensis]TFB19610.1 hypothetical protein E3U55_10650 [Filobacillus milosensis]